MSKLRLYGITPYDRSAKVRWLLTELGLDFEMKYLDREKRENISPEYLRLNPMGRVPALQIDDKTMIESAAICTYLADQYSLGKMAPKLDSPERAEYLQWMYFATTTLDTFRTRVMIIEDIPQGELYTKKMSALQEDMQDALAALEGVLKNKSFLLGRFTTADICMSYDLYWCTLWPELGQFFKNYPAVTAYIERMRAYPSAAKAEVFSYQE